jgi:hypothetical protein
MQNSRARVWVGFVIAIVGTGCGAQPDDVGSVAVTTQAVLSDPTGTIHVTIGACSPVSFSGGSQSLSCTWNSGGVPTSALGLVTVGGGGQVVGEPVPGALLQASLPRASDGANAAPGWWIFGAKDHAHPSAFQLQMAVIGLQIQSVDARVLHSLVKVRQARSPSGQHVPTATAMALPGEVVLSGGGWCIGQSQSLVQSQQLMWASTPFPQTGESTPTGWTVSCKDHEYSDPGYAEAFVVVMPRCLPSGLCFASKTLASPNSVAGGGYRPLEMSGNGAITGVGARTSWRGAGGRMLTSIFPYESTTGGMLHADSKDHDIATPGYTAGYMIALSRAN